MRRSLLALASSLPYQRLADSPTKKHYVNWKLYEPYIESSTPASRGVVEKRLLNDFCKPNVILGVGGARGDGQRIREEIGLAPFDYSSGRLLAFHRAIWDVGALLSLEYSSACILVEKPADGVKGYHLAVDAKGDSSLSILLPSPVDALGLSTVSIEVRVRPHSNLNLDVLLFDSNTSPSAVYTSVVLEEEATLRKVTLAGRGRMLYVEDSVRLEGRSSRFLSSGLLAAPEGAHIVYNSKALSIGELTESRIDVAGYANRGFLVHKGLSRVAGSARGSVATLRSELTPLSSGSFVYAAPMLEIETSEVKEAGHSTAEAPIDEDVVFYLRSRGLTVGEALRIIIKGAYVSALSTAIGGEWRLSSYLEELLEALGL